MAAWSSAASSGRWTIEIPMLDPRRAGLMTSRGSGKSAANAARSRCTASRSAASSAARISTHGRTGSSIAPQMRLKSVLSMPTADAAGPDPQ